MTHPSSEPIPAWEARVRAPRLVTGALMTPTISWSADQSGRGVVLSTLSGRVEAHTFDTDRVPVCLRQMTDRPDGTVDAGISPDGQWVYWFDDTSGDEVGRFRRQPYEGGRVVTLLEELPASEAAGFVPRRGGGLIAGRLGECFEIAVSDPSGQGRIAYVQDDAGWLRDVSADDSLALITHEPVADALHVQTRVVRLADGTVLDTLGASGVSLAPVAFRPGDPDCVLILDHSGEFAVPTLWYLSTGARAPLSTGLPGELSASWYPDGASLLLTSLVDGRHTVHRLDLGTEELLGIAAPGGAVAASSARPDGTVHLLHSRSDQPAAILRVEGVGADVRMSVALSASHGRTPSAVRATDVFAQGPGGRVHALLTEPEGQRPHPVVFVVHGGPYLQDLHDWVGIPPAMNDAGYAVVRVNFRGSTGYGTTWREALHRDIGRIECEDIAAVRTQLVADGVISPDRAAVAGLSWGGYVALFALGTEPGIWRSGIALSPLADWELSWEFEPPAWRAGDAAMLGGRLEDIPEVFRAASPITYADAVRAPLLVTAGVSDPRCPVRQVDTYVERLTARGHDVRYHRRPAGHVPWDLDAQVREITLMRDFLAETLPVET